MENVTQKYADPNGGNFHGNPMGSEFVKNHQTNKSKILVGIPTMPKH